MIAKTKYHTIAEWNFSQTNLAKPRKWFQPRRRWHDPLLVLNMSIFNSENGWNRILNRLPSY